MKRTPMPPRTARLKSKTRLKQSNPERQAKRRKNYKRFLASAAWKAIRLATFAHDGWRCTATLTTVLVDRPGSYLARHERCPYVDESRTGKGLEAHHQKYALRFGGDEIPGVDTTTRCTSCHRRHHAAVGQVHGTPTQGAA